MLTTSVSVPNSFKDAVCFQQEYKQQLEDFFEVTEFLPYKQPEFGIKDIIYPGEGINSTSITEVLRKLNSADRSLLMKHLILNGVFHVKKFGVYDWGYLVYDGGITSIPYTLTPCAVRELNVPTTYHLYGEEPSLFTLNVFCTDQLLWATVVDEYLCKTRPYVKDIYKRVTTHVNKWAEFVEVISQSIRDLESNYPTEMKYDMRR